MTGNDARDPQGIGPCAPLRGPRSDLAAVNRDPTLRVELHLLAAPAESCRKRRRAIGR